LANLVAQTNFDPEGTLISGAYNPRKLAKSGQNMHKKPLLLW
jgi:hypothetical protein